MSSKIFLFLLCIYADYAHDYDGDDNDDEDGGEDDDGGDDGGYDGGGSDDDVHLEGEAGVDLLELAFARIRDVEFDLLPS